VIGAPPVLAGAVQLTVSSPSPGVTVTPVGGSADLQLTLSTCPTSTVPPLRWQETTIARVVAVATQVGERIEPRLIQWDSSSAVLTSK
jgi:hypothetical protein